MRGKSRDGGKPRKDRSLAGSIRELGTVVFGRARRSQTTRLTASARPYRRPHDCLDSGAPGGWTSIRTRHHARDANRTPPDDSKCLPHRALPSVVSTATWIDLRAPISGAECSIAGSNVSRAECWGDRLDEIASRRDWTCRSCDRGAAVRPSALQRRTPSPSVSIPNFGARWMIERPPRTPPRRR